MPNQWNFSSARLNRIRFVFYHNIKDNERNLCQDLLQEGEVNFACVDMRALTR